VDLFRDPARFAQDGLRPIEIVHTQGKQWLPVYPEDPGAGSIGKRNLRKDGCSGSVASLRAISDVGIG
jgi:hypothetical protein